MPRITQTLFREIDRTIKGTGSIKRMKRFDKTGQFGLNKNLYWFLNFKDEPLMRSRLQHTILEKLYLSEFAAKLLGSLLVSYWLFE